MQKKQNVATESQSIQFPFAKTLLTVVLGLLTFAIMIHLIRSSDVLVSRVFGIKPPQLREIWENHQRDFKSSQFLMMTPDFLAALALQEASPSQEVMNSRTSSIFEQRPRVRRSGLIRANELITERYSGYCLENGRHFENKGLLSFGPCWSRNFVMNRSDSRSIELASMGLGFKTYSLLKHHNALKVDLSRKQVVAALIHKCGIQIAQKYILNGFNFKGLVCENEKFGAYMAQVRAYQRSFKILAKNDM